MELKQLLYLSRADVEKVNLEMKIIIQLLENMFREKGAGRVEMPPKPGIHTRPDAFIHAMPAYIPPCTPQELNGSVDIQEIRNMVFLILPVYCA